MMSQSNGVSFIGIKNSSFLNNIIILRDPSFPVTILIYVSNSLFQNNYINQYSASAGYNNCEFLNNAFLNNNVTFPSGTNLGSNNISDQSFEDTFVDFDGNGSIYDFDFHIKLSSLAINAGMDSTEIGIYGGTCPWKEGGLPAYPHIYFKDINFSTNEDGELPIKINVRTEN